MAPRRRDRVEVPERLDVEDQGAPGFLEPCVDRVEVGVTRRAAVSRPGGQQHHLGPLLDDGFDLGDRRLQVAQRQQRRGVDPVLVVETPCVVEPPVERPQVGIERLGVVDVVFGGQRHARREYDRALDILFGHHLQPGLAFEPLGLHGLRLVGFVRVARAHLLEHLLERTGTVSQIEAEARFAVEGGHPMPGQDHFLAVGRAHRRNRPVLKLLGQIAGKRIPRLIAVGVAVEDPVVEFGRHGAFLPGENDYSPISENILSWYANAHPGVGQAFVHLWSLRRAGASVHSREI